MTITINGLIIKNPNSIILAKFGKKTDYKFESIPYQLYDGYGFDENNRNSISLEDVLITTAMNSNINASTLLNCWNSFLNCDSKAKEIGTKREKIQNALKQIPYGASLEADNWENWIGPLKIVLKELLEISRIGPAVATKILHRKRPCLIPMWDSYIDSFFYWVSSKKIGAGKPKKENGHYLGRYVRGKNEASIEEIVDDLIFGIKLFRETLVSPSVNECLKQVQKIANEKGGYDLTLVRILESIIWWQIVEQQDANVVTKEVLKEIYEVYERGKWKLIE